MEMNGPSPTPPPAHNVKPPASTPQQVAAAAAALAASRAASVSAAMRSVFGAKQQAALASAMMNAAAVAAAATPKPGAALAMQSSFDGLPVLPPHAAACAVDHQTPRLDALASEHDVPRDGAVALFGEPSTRSSVRAALLHHYAATNQLASAKEGAISEMTLRMDTELEMLRRQCFAERNARWNFDTPDMFADFAPTAEPAWVAAPYVAPRKQVLMLRKYRERNPHDKSAVDEGDSLLQSIVGPEHVRERAWPPKEFVSKANTKPSRGGANANAANRTTNGKKKPVGMAGVVDETPVTARVCAECLTQSSALWRKRPRASKAGVPPPPAVVSTIDPATGVAMAPPTATQVAIEEEDVCLPCYLKTQRRDLFDRKAAEKVRRAKEEAARAAAEARALKKQQQQIQKKIKKLQQQQHANQDEADGFKADDGFSQDATGTREELEDPLRPIIIRRDSTSGDALAIAVADDKKKRDKKSKKDKKKKKKKKKKKAEWDDSDSDDDGTASSVVLPSPPQRPMDGFVYADRTEASASRDELEAIKSSSSTQKRAATSSRSSSSSKKRKSSDGQVDVPAAAPPPVVPPTPTASSASRGSRARASSSTQPTAAPPTPTPSSARKRARPTKKESARERELRALGQYCPVCNMTYEEDDASPFVCCDSCEMWVHAACDPTLTPEALAKLSDPSEKYICPLCGGR